MNISLLKHNPVLRKAFVWILNNSTSNYLPYHNIKHIMTVFNWSYQLGTDEMGVHDPNDSLKVSEADLDSLLLAALFHDVNHSGGALTDDLNIAKAIRALNDFIKYGDLTDVEKSTINLEQTISILSETQFPYKEDPKSILGEIIRDADMMSGLEEDWLEVIFFGLYKEIGISDINKMLDSQYNFIHNMKLFRPLAKEYYKSRLSSILTDIANLRAIYNPQKLD